MCFKKNATGLVDHENTALYDFVCNLFSQTGVLFLDPCGKKSKYLVRSSIFVLKYATKRFDHEDAAL